MGNPCREAEIGMRSAREGYRQTETIQPTVVKPNSYRQTETIQPTVVKPNSPHERHYLSIIDAIHLSYLGL